MAAQNGQSSEELTRMADGLKELVGRFQLDSRGTIMIAPLSRTIADL